MTDAAQLHKVASNWEARIFIEGSGEAERRLEVTPAVAGWEYLSFRTYTFRAGQVIHGESAADEMCMVLLSGSIEMAVAGAGVDERWELARPGGVFGDAPSAVYLPPDHTYTMTVHADADCAYGRAPAEGTRAPRLITAEDAAALPDDPYDQPTGGRGTGPLDGGPATGRGTGSLAGGPRAGRGQRHYHVLRPGEAERLTCAETVTPEGGWSHWPAERHAPLDRVAASLVNEVNYYRVEEEGGWGLQRLGTHDPARDDVVILNHGDAVMVRHGSFPVAASPGSRLWALAFRAGATSEPAAVSESEGVVDGLP